MAKDKISDYSSTANSNTDIAGINIDEGCAPSGINDAIRTLMSQLKTWQSGGQDVYIHPAGTASAPSITANGDTNTGIFFPAADTVGITTGGTERVRVDSAGNAGLGVTPSAWGGSFRALQVGAVSSTYVSSAGDVIFGRNTYNNGTNSLYLTSNYASAYGMISGQHQWYTAASGTAGNAITFTQAMTLDSSGNLGVGSTSPAMSLNGNTRALYLYKNDTNGAGVRLESSNTNFEIIAGDSGVLMYSTGDDPIRFGTSNTERARIDSSGNLLVGTTTNPDSNLTGVGISSAIGKWALAISAYNRGYVYSATTDGYPAFFVQGGSTVGYIATTSTTTTYATSSDYRLKNSIAPMTGALAKVAALKPVTYKWNANGSDGEGFIAHELAEVCPNAVTGAKDAVDEDGNPVYQGIDTSFLVATLTAAIQELKATVDAQAARITALEQA